MPRKDNCGPTLNSHSQHQEKSDGIWLAVLNKFNPSRRFILFRAPSLFESTLWPRHDIVVDHIRICWPQRLAWAKMDINQVLEATFSAGLSKFLSWSFTTADMLLQMPRFEKPQKTNWIRRQMTTLYGPTPTLSRSIITDTTSVGRLPSNPFHRTRKRSSPTCDPASRWTRPQKCPYFPWHWTTSSSPDKMATAHWSRGQETSQTAGTSDSQFHKLSGWKCRSPTHSRNRCNWTASEWVAGIDASVGAKCGIRNRQT